MEEGIVTLAVFGVFGIGWIVFEWLPNLRERRANDRWMKEENRRKRGLPPHEYCFCKACVAWRANITNITGLQ